MMWLLFEAVNNLTLSRQTDHQYFFTIHLIHPSLLCINLLFPFCWCGTVCSFSLHEIYNFYQILLSLKPVLQIWERLREAVWQVAKCHFIQASSRNMFFFFLKWLRMLLWTLSTVLLWSVSVLCGGKRITPVCPKVIAPRHVTFQIWLRSFGPFLSNFRDSKAPSSVLLCGSGLKSIEGLFVSLFFWSFRFNPVFLSK